MPDTAKWMSPYGATEYVADQSEFKVVKFPFGKYELTLKLSPNNEFLDVLEIRVNKDFAASIKEKQPKGFHDVDEFYPEK